MSTVTMKPYKRTTTIIHLRWHFIVSGVSSREYERLLLRERKSFFLHLKWKERQTVLEAQAMKLINSQHQYLLSIIFSISSQLVPRWKRWTVEKSRRPSRDIFIVCFLNDSNINEMSVVFFFRAQAQRSWTTVCLFAGFLVKKIKKNKVSKRVLSEAELNGWEEESLCPNNTQQQPKKRASSQF